MQIIMASILFCVNGRRPGPSPGPGRLRQIVELRASTSPSRLFPPAVGQAEAPRATGSSFVGYEPAEYGPGGIIRPETAVPNKYGTSPVRNYVVGVGFGSSPPFV